MQTKKQSFIEAISNTAVGFIISYASTFLIFPAVGLQTSPGTNLIITIYFTVISILRGYVIRRWFNKKPNKKYLTCQCQKRSDEWLDDYNVYRCWDCNKVIKYDEI